MDENYIRESIENPNAKIRQGFQGTMTPFTGKFKEVEIAVIIEHGMKRMYQDMEDGFYYMCLHNEPYAMPAMPAPPTPPSPWRPPPSRARPRTSRSSPASSGSVPSCSVRSRSIRVAAEVWVSLILEVVRFLLALWSVPGDWRCVIDRGGPGGCG